MERSAAWRGRRIQTAAGQLVVYRRGQRTVSITIVSVTEAESEVVGDKDSVKTGITWAEWEIIASELIIGGEVTEPRPGDRIERTVNGVEMIWEVMPKENLRHFDRQEESWQLLKVRTKRIANG